MFRCGLRVTVNEAGGGSTQPTDTGCVPLHMDSGWGWRQVASHPPLLPVAGVTPRYDREFALSAAQAVLKDGGRAGVCSLHNSSACAASPSYPLARFGGSRLLKPDINRSAFQPLNLHRHGYRYRPGSALCGQGCELSQSGQSHR